MMSWFKMTTRKAIIGLMIRYLLFAALLIALILYLASMIAVQLDEASRPDKFSIYVRVTTPPPGSRLALYHPGVVV